MTEPYIGRIIHVLAISQAVSQFHQRQFALTLKDHICVLNAFITHEGRMHSTPQYRDVEFILDVLGQHPCLFCVSRLESIYRPS